MKETVDNIIIDSISENAKFYEAVEFERTTNEILYLTGKAGTGKTTFLKYIKQTTKKPHIILAPTGVAAINAGGVTIHSFFQIPFGPFIPNDSRLRRRTMGSEALETIFTTFNYREEKKEIIKNLELLIIDEISMVRADMLDVIDRILKVYRNQPSLPFGGVQVILIGDTFQLPPIVDNTEWSILSQHYKTPFFFSSKVLEQSDYAYIELKKIYRQKEQEFIDLLNRVRVSDVNEKDLSDLNAKYNPTFTGNGKDYIILATTNKIVNETNVTKLKQLETELFSFEAKIKGSFPDKHKPTEHYLQLKVGAQVMLIRNDTETHKRYINGSIAKIKELENNKIIIEFDDVTKPDLTIGKEVWNNIQYSYNKDKKKITEEIVGTFEQFPIRLAWAITVHKSQGLTFDKVIADLGNSFASGQVYVALSRCTTSTGLILRTKLNKDAIKTDPRVIEFAKNESPNTLITDRLNIGKADFYYKKARENFTKENIKFAFDFFKKALKFRNDIDTDIFKKFVEVRGKHLLDYKQKNSLLINQLELTNNELLEAKENIEFKTDELNNKSTKISEQDSSIGLLLEKTSEFENKTELLKKSLKLTKKKLSDSKTHLKKIETKLQKTESGLRNKKKENQINKVEIERLKNLKWYDKLIGNK
jgi:ABC-type cobalamin/Fe3+-siderophores transport system ATPase subunit